VATKDKPRKERKKPKKEHPKPLREPTAPRTVGDVVSKNRPH
jgi:hypothetical protein